MLAAAFLLVACSGDDDNGSNAAGDSSGPAEATAPPDIEPTAVPVLPAAASLSQLPSYRYEVIFEGTGSIADSLGIGDLTGAPTGDSFKYSVKGAWIAPDQAQLELSFAGQQVKQTIIGNQQWVTLGDAASGPVPADGRAEDLILAASFINESTIGSTLEDFDCSDTEEVNGVATLKCVGDLEDFQQSEDQLRTLLEGANVREVTAFDSTIWVAEQGGYAVKADMRVAGKTGDNRDFALTLNVNVTDIGKVTEIKP
jgi:hypothetical protein